MDIETEELNASDLGTLEYWDEAYSRELENFKEHGDPGEIWFGRTAFLKVLSWISSNRSIAKTERIVDIGCGNGMALVELWKKGFTNLLGLDYSEKAIDLAREILKEHKINVELRVSDILRDDLPSDFRVAHDKGTYDAISLNPEDPGTKRSQYIQQIHKILVPNGFLILTSCNWTKEELESQFQKYFTLDAVLPSDSFQFGGRKGAMITQLVFRKKN